MTIDYSRWLGKRVVIHIASRDCHVDLRCMLVDHSATKVRVRVDDGWDVDIFKEMILGIEREMPGFLERNSPAFPKFDPPLRIP